MATASSIDPMSELRIVLLGKSGEEKSKVGNIILGKVAFKTKSFSLKIQQCKSVSEMVHGRHVTVINTPNLLEPQLSDRKLFHHIERCVTLSAPGPHAFLLVLQNDCFKKDHRKILERILKSFSDEAFKCSVALVTLRSKESQLARELESCTNQCHSLIKTDQIDHILVAELMKKIYQIEKKNRGQFLSSEIFKEPECIAPGAHKSSPMGTEEMIERRPLQQALLGEQQGIEKGGKVTGDGKTEKDPRKRHSNDLLPPNLSELRIVLLGRSGEEKSKVGNIILKREAFETQPSFFIGEQQCERARGLVDGSHVTVINTPDSLHSQISQYELDKQVELCVSLSDPGPHVLLLVLQPDRFTEKDKDRAKRILSMLGDHDLEYTMVLVTQKAKMDVFIDEQTHSIALFIEECRGRYHKFNHIYETDHTQIVQFMEKITAVVKENEERYLTCQIFKDLESGATSIMEDSQTRFAQLVAREYEPQSQGEKETHEENVDISSERLNLVVFGRRGAGKTSAVNAILGQRGTSVDISPSSVYESREGEVCGHLVTVVELPALCEAPISTTTVSHLFTSLCGPGVHAFLLVIQVGSLTDDDKAEIARIQEIFGSRVTDYIMILFIHDTPTAELVVDFVTQRKEMQEPLKICSNRFCVFNNQVIVKNPVVPELLEAVEKMNKEAGSCFSLDMYLKSQLERTARELEDRYNTALEEKDRRIRELEENMGKSPGVEVKGQISDCVRIVLVGKTGNGKSATGNTILQRNEFKSEPSAMSVTTCCHKQVGNVAGRRVAVVDTPGLFDTSLNNEQVQQEIGKCISFLAPGPHVFLLVLQIGRITEEEKKTLQLIKETFGKMAEMFTIVLFTRGDDLNISIESFIQRSDPMLQNLIHDCGDRIQVFNNKDQSNITQVTELLDKIDMMVQKNGGGCYTNEMFQEAERTIKKECERILREKEGEMEREREKLKAKHEEEMEEMKRRMEEQRRMEEEERAHWEKELKDKEENLKKEIKALKKKEQEVNERREEDEKRWKSQELEWKSKIDEMDEEKRRIKGELQHKEEEEKKRLETEEKRRQELIKKQEREKREFEEKLAEEKKKRNEEEQERKIQEERERREWEERIKESEKEKKGILEDMKERAEEWELQREKELKWRVRTEIWRKQREDEEREAWEWRQQIMIDEFENQIFLEREKRMKEIQDKEKITKDLEEKKRQMKKEKEEWEKKRMEEKERRDKEDQRREKEKKELEGKLQEEQKESLRRMREHEAREEAARKQLQAKEEDHKRKVDEMKLKFKEDARKQAEECIGFEEELIKLDIEVKDLPILKEMREALKDKKHERLLKYLNKKIKKVEEKRCSVM